MTTRCCMRSSATAAGKGFKPSLGDSCPQVSEDPELADGGDYNLFRYCHNDPVDNVDPMGLVSEQTGDVSSGTHDREWKMNMSSKDRLELFHWQMSTGAIGYGLAAYAYQQLRQTMGGSVSTTSSMTGNPAFSISYLVFTSGSKKFWSKWAAQFAQRWQDLEFRSWWSRVVSAADAYVIGPRAHATLPYTMPRAADGSSAVQRASAIRVAHQDAGINLTHYGYRGDPYSDSNTRLGLGSRNNILNPDSVALSPDKARGIPFGGPVEVNGHFIGFYHDSTSRSLANRVDIYDPNGEFQ